MERNFKLNFLAVFFSLIFFFYLLQNLYASSSPNTSEAPWVGRVIADRVIAASSPDNNFEVLVSAIDSAERSIYLEVYELTQEYIGDALERALDRGVSVYIYLEGIPATGKVPEAELAITDRLVQKGAYVYFYLGYRGNRRRRSFRFVHAKVALIDGIKAIVGSANYGTRGHPIHPRSGLTTGNREWEVLLEGKDIAKLFGYLFRNDFGKLFEQWVPYGYSDRFRFQNPDFIPRRSVLQGNYRHNLRPVEARDVVVQTVLAPENSLNKLDGSFLKYLEEAQFTVEVQQLNFETYWGLKRYNPVFEESPMVAILTKLARQGRHIRILLNDDYIFRDHRVPHLFNELTDTMPNFFEYDKLDPALTARKNPERDNRATLRYFNNLAELEGLNVRVKLLDYRNCDLLVLHNKGMIVDAKNTLIGSLNWGESALKFNREAGVVVEDPRIASYYRYLFEYDWRCSSARN